MRILEELISSGTYDLHVHHVRTKFRFSDRLSVAARIVCNNLDSADVGNLLGIRIRAILPACFPCIALAIWIVFIFIGISYAVMRLVPCGPYGHLFALLASTGIAAPRIRYGLFLRAMRVALRVTFFYKSTGHRTSVIGVAIFLACHGINSSR